MVVHGTTVGLATMPVAALSAAAIIIATANANRIEVISDSPLGSCTIDADGCATDGPGDYGNNEMCTYRLTSNGYLTATGTFSTEGITKDFLIFNNASSAYGGDGGDGSFRLPEGSAIGPTGAMRPTNIGYINLRDYAGDYEFTWVSDGSNVDAGYTICLSGTRPPLPPPAPTVQPTDIFNCVGDIRGSSRPDGCACHSRDNTASYFGGHELCESDCCVEYDFSTVSPTPPAQSPTQYPTPTSSFGRRPTQLPTPDGYCGTGTALFPGERECQDVGGLIGFIIGMVCLVGACAAGGAMFYFRRRNNALMHTDTAAMGFGAYQEGHGAYQGGGSGDKGGLQAAAF